MPTTVLNDQIRADVETLWDFNQMHHHLRPVDLGVGLGSHDLGVATYTAELYHQGMFPRIVFTGANAPTTIERFPRGEAVHYREHALELGVPDSAILVEPKATNTGELSALPTTPCLRYVPPPLAGGGCRLRLARGVTRRLRLRNR